MAYIKAIGHSMSDFLQVNSNNGLHKNESICFS